MALMRDKQAVLLGIAGVGLVALPLCVTAARPAVYLALAMQGLASSLIGPVCCDQPGVRRTNGLERAGRDPDVPLALDIKCPS